MADTSGDSSLGGGGAATAAVPAGDGPCCCRVPGCTEPLQSSHNVVRLDTKGFQPQVRQRCWPAGWQLTLQQ